MLHKQLHAATASASESSSGQLCRFECSVGWSAQRLLRSWFLPAVLNVGTAEEGTSENCLDLLLFRWAWMTWRRTNKNMRSGGSEKLLQLQRQNGLPVQEEPMICWLLIRRTNTSLSVNVPDRCQFFNNMPALFYQSCLLNCPLIFKEALCVNLEFHTC